MMNEDATRSRRRAVPPWERQGGEHLTDEEWIHLDVLRLTLRIVLRAREQAAHSAGVEYEQYTALLVLRTARVRSGTQQKPMIVSELASSLLLKPHSAVELVERMEQRGLVVREQDKVDNRRKFVHLTDEGMRIVEQGAITDMKVHRKIGLSLVKAILAVIDTPPQEQGTV